LFDPLIEDEEEKEMTNEAGAIFGLVNLWAKNMIPKEMILHIDPFQI